MPGLAGPSQRISGFDPRSIIGCKLWLDATDTSSLTGSSPVTTWKDKSIYANNTTSYGGSPSTSASAINGKQAIYFNGSSYFTGAISGANTTTITVFIIGSLISPFTSFSGLLCFGNSSQLDYDNVGSLCITMYNAESALYASRNSSSQKTPISAGVPFMYVLQYDGTYINTWLNGTQQTDPSINIASSGTFTYTNFSIANRAGTTGNYPWSGYFGEIVVYQSALTTSQRQAVEGYLAYKWGLQTSLISTQSFKLSRPFSRQFSPIDIPSCLFWWDAADGSTLTLTGSQVNSWRNKGSWDGSASSYSGTVVSGTTKYNGLNVVVFPTNGELRFTVAIPYQPRAWFAVFRQTTQVTVSGPNNTQYFAIINQTQGSGQDALFGPGLPTTQGTTSYILAEGPSGITISVSTGNTVPDGYNVMKQYAWINSAASTASNFQTVNGTSYALTTTNTATGYRTDSVTYSINTGWYNNSCDLAEIIMYNAEITTSQIQQIEGYLAWKWGINTSLPATHPYIKFPPSSAIPFLPTNLSGCALWLDGADPAGTGVTPANGGTITAWIDKSTKNVSSTITGTLTYQASFANNNGSIRFTGTQYIQNTTFTLALSVKTFFIVCSSYAATANGMPAGYIYFGNVGNVYDQQNGTAYQGPEAGFNNNFGFLQGYGNGGYYTSSGTSLGETPLGIYGDTQNSTTASLYVNGSLLQTNTTSYTPGLATGFRIGRRSDNLGATAYYLYGNICEIIVYNVVLSTEQRKKVEGYLASKWGLSNSLPNIHPYRKFPPAQESYIPVLAPNAPTLNAPTNTTSTLNMSWTAGSGGTPVTYTVYVYAAGVLVTGSGGTQTISYPTASTTFSPMTSGVAYTFYVSATNTGGTSSTAGPSSSVTYTGGTVITATGAGSVSLGSGSSIIIECWGGGGGSMGSDSYTGAGAGGAYAKTTISVSGAFTLYYNVGTGGTGSSGSGSAGGSTWANISANSSPSSTTQGALAAGGAGSGVAGPNNSSQSAGSIGNTVYIGGYGGYSGPENGGGGAASSGGNGGAGTSGSGTAGGSAGTGGGAGGAGGGGSYSGQDGYSSVEGGGGGGGSYNNAGGNGGAPGGAGGMGWSVQNTASPGPNTNSHGYGGNGGRGQIRYTRT